MNLGQMDDRHLLARRRMTGDLVMTGLHLLRPRLLLLRHDLELRHAVMVDGALAVVVVVPTDCWQNRVAASVPAPQHRTAADLNSDGGLRCFHQLKYIPLQ